jgi:hypothetical protein
MDRTNSPYSALAIEQDGSMPFRSLNSTPAQLAHIDVNFRRAWHDVNLLRTLDAERQAEHKEWLAQIILALATEQPHMDIADLAVRQFIATVPSMTARET